MAYCVNGEPVAAAVRQTFAATAIASGSSQPLKRVAAKPRGPVQTQPPLAGVDSSSGGVAIGWPGVKSPKLRQQMGLGLGD